jgi:23S rRNA pseudouridine1911/1915/1917 synthase
LSNPTTPTPLHPDRGDTQRVVAPPEAAGTRADRFITDVLGAAIGGLSRSRVKALIEAGQVTRDGIAMRDPSEAVRAGATYTLTLPPPEPASPQPQSIPLTILFEDRHLLVIDKPAGLVVHPAPGNQDGTLVNAVLAHAAEDLTGIGGEKRPGIVHRLDKDTSGVMVVAKSERAHTVLSEAFASRDLDREYLALCWGVPSPTQGEIDAPIGRHPIDRKRMAVVERQGKHALTRYRTERGFGTACALLRCRLATGRTHQIRVHLSHIGHPIVGDPVYLKRTPACAKGLPAATRDRLLAFPRQALHAATLGFRHPITGESLSFSTPVPPDMAALLVALGGDDAWSSKS